MTTITEEQILKLKKVFAISRMDFLEKIRGKALAEQRSFLEQKARDYLKYMLGMDENIVETCDEIRELIEDYVSAVQVKKPVDLHCEKWKPWLSSERKKGIKWEYSDRYFDYLSEKPGWTAEAIQTIDESTDVILDHCGDPKQKNFFEVKGLVIGDIQSGKTANYTSLINKAIDCGYKIIIVLTGTTNDLRSQTQKRLDKEVAGFKTNPSDEDDENQDCAEYGVAKYGFLNNLNILTNASINGDLKRYAGGLNDISENSHCYMAILKKNPSSLTSITKFLRNCPATKQDKDKKMPFPVLVIDDESDLASVNTKDSNEIAKAAKTNALIRELLFKTCHRFSYVGYTATPFANVFIKQKYNVAENDTDDIFPKDFIVALPTPKDYCGPVQYFGKNPKAKFGEMNVKTDLVVPIDPTDLDAFDGFFSDDNKCYAIPASLREAIKCFLIGTGIKIHRNIIENYTMLINIDVKVAFNTSLRDEVRYIFDKTCSSFVHEEKTRNEFKKYWEDFMMPVSKNRMEGAGKVFTDRWDGENGIEESIKKAIKLKTNSSVKLIVGNKDADTLDYSKTKQGIYVCVGGQKLSRGLTLEGLSVSYYGRHSKAIDTLLQMGRWFGYKKDWLDVCRVFTTAEIAEDFIRASIATENFKSQIRRMNENGASPEKFGLYVQIETERLEPTSRAKRRNAERMDITYSGRLSQTIDFSKSHNKQNLAELETFIGSLQQPVKKNGFHGLIFKGIEYKKILLFLNKIKSPSSRVQEWLEYIKRRNADGELLNWTVIISSLDLDGLPNERKFTICGHTIGKPSRVLRLDNDDPDEIRIRALTSPNDYTGYFPEDADPQPDRNGYHPDTDEAIKKYYKPQDCILVLYIVDIHKEDKNGNENAQIIEGGNDILGAAIWFPVSKKAAPIVKYLNQVAKEEYYDDDSASITQGE